MMNERGQNIAVGITVLLGVIGFAFTLLLFGYIPAWFDEGYAVRVDLDQAIGLHEGGIVAYRGIEVGRVESIELVLPPDVGVVATLHIHEEIELPANVRGVLETSVLGSTATLGLHADDWLEADGPIQFLVRDGSAVIQGETFSAFGAINKFAIQMASLSDEWTEVGQNLNLILEPRGMADVDAGSMLGNVSTIVARFDERLAQFKTVMNGIEDYVNDPQLLENFKGAAANAKQLTEQLSKDMAAIRTRYIAMADDASAAIMSLKKTLDASRSPDGTLGKLLGDPKLYDNINDSFERLQKTIDEVRLLIEKWKAEGLPVQL